MGVPESAWIRLPVHNSNERLVRHHRRHCVVAVTSPAQVPGYTDMKVSLKVFNLIAAAVFAVFSLLQWNDLDPAIYAAPSVLDAVVWAAFYALVAALFLLVLIRPLPRWILLLATICCLIQLGRTAPGVWENLSGDQPFTITQAGMTGDDPRVELSREFFGALIALLGVGIVALENRRGVRSTPRDGTAS